MSTSTMGGYSRLWTVGEAIAHAAERRGGAQEVSLVPRFRVLIEIGVSPQRDPTGSGNAPTATNTGRDRITQNPRVNALVSRPSDSLLVADSSTVFWSHKVAVQRGLNRGNLSGLIDTLADVAPPRCLVK